MADRWRQVEELFHRALEREEPDRSAFLDEACAGDEALRRDVESLLVEEAESGFMETPAMEGEARELAQENRPGLEGRRIGTFEILSLLGRGGQRTFPSVQFERYADDAIVHCRSERQARAVLEAIRGRFEQCGLELHPVKTRIVYCKDDDRPGDYEHVKFDFLGYTFQPRRAKNRCWKFFVSFLPAISAKAAKKIRATIREWRMASTRNNQRLEDLARLINPSVRGWMHYYGRFYRSKCVQVLRHLNEALAAWARWKYKRFRRRERASMHWLGRIARRDRQLFVL